MDRIERTFIAPPRRNLVVTAKVQEIQRFKTQKWKGIRMDGWPDLTDGSIDG